MLATTSQLGQRSPCAGCVGGSVNAHTFLSVGGSVNAHVLLSVGYVGGSVNAHTLLSVGYVGGSVNAHTLLGLVELRRSFMLHVSYTLIDSISPTVWYCGRRITGRKTPSYLRVRRN